MIVDLILDRQEGKKYNPKQFYDAVVGYGEIGYEIAEALDNGEEVDIKRALASYIIEQEYNLNIINYINSQKWLK